MSSLNDDFNELLERIRRGRELGAASFEPVYYLVFDPKQILEVKRLMHVWTSRLHNDGWNVQVFSIAEEIHDILQSDQRRKFWLMSDRGGAEGWAKANQSITNALVQGEALQKRLEARLESLQGASRSVLLVSDLEALHPYMRIGAIESQLQGRFFAPTVFLYPGIRTGKTRLKFLGFYPDDGNYRSVHVGG